MKTNEFIPHGGFATCNYGGMEIQISDDNSMARFRTNLGKDSIGEPTEWLEIEFDADGEAYCKLNDNNIEYLSNYSRYNR